MDKVIEVRMGKIKDRVINNGYKGSLVEGLTYPLGRGNDNIYRINSNTFAVVMVYVNEQEIYNHLELQPEINSMKADKYGTIFLSKKRYKRYLKNGFPSIKPYPIGTAAITTTSSALSADYYIYNNGTFEKSTFIDIWRKDRALAKHINNNYMKNIIIYNDTMVVRESIYDLYYQYQIRGI